MSDIATTALQLERTFAVPREQVFRAWSQSQALKLWFCVPGDGYVGLGVALDFAVGGSYRAEMRNPNEEVIAQVGSFLEIVPDERIVYTMTWDGLDLGEAMGETMVAVSFADAAEGATAVTVTHVGFPDET